MAQQKGQDVSKLYAIPEIERELLYLFKHYCNIKGQEPLTFTELDSWQRVTGNTLSPGEVDLIFVIDSAYYTVKHKSE